MNQTDTVMTPVRAGERIQILDILRGFAVFGILAVNIAGFASPSIWPGYVAPEMPWYDSLAHKLVQFLAEAKFYSIFSFLFGLGFAVQLGRAEARGTDIRSFYPRRLLLLLGFGLLHSVLLWTADILRLYALLGFALMAFRKRSNRTLLIAAGAFFGISLVLVSLFGGQTGGSTGAIPGLDLVGLARYAYQSTSYLDVLTFQFFGAIGVFIFLTFTQGPGVMALFLLGLLAGRLRIFANLAQHRRLAQRVLVAGGLIGLAGGTLLVFAEASWLSGLGLAVSGPALAAAYIAGLSLLSLRPRGAVLLAPLAPVGRMALTNYILQSLVCALLFYGVGLGWYEQVGAAGLLGITAVIYLGQVVLSGWWMKRFMYGPLEWLWRSLTYRQRQPLRAAEYRPAPAAAD